MDISNIIGVLFFILPGLLSENVKRILDYPEKERESDFIIAINGVLKSFPIVFIISTLSSIINKVSTLTEFKKLFDDLYFLATFTIATVLISIIFGIVSFWIEKWELDIINKYRKKIGKMELNSGNNWKKFFIDNEKARYLEVIINGYSVKGFAAGYSIPGEPESLILETDEILYMYDDYDPQKFFTNVIGTYIDLEKNVVIKDYDMAEFNKWVEEKREAAKKTNKPISHSSAV